MWFVDRFRDSMIFECYCQYVYKPLYLMHYLRWNAWFCFLLRFEQMDLINDFEMQHLIASFVNFLSNIHWGSKMRHLMAKQVGEVFGCLMPRTSTTKFHICEGHIIRNPAASDEVPGLRWWRYKCCGMQWEANRDWSSMSVWTSRRPTSRAWLDTTWHEWPEGLE